MINKTQYTELYKKQYNRVIPECQKKYAIDSDFIYDISEKKTLKYKISDIIDLLNFYYDFKRYIYELKKSDKIKIYSYGRIADIKITKINYRKKLNKRGEKVISSFTYSEILNNGGVYGGKVKITDIIYQNVKFYDILDVCRHFWSYLFFDVYTINDANEILQKIRGIK